MKRTPRILFLLTTGPVTSEEAETVTEELLDIFESVRPTRTIPENQEVAEEEDEGVEIERVIEGFIDL